MSRNLDMATPYMKCFAKALIMEAALQLNLNVFVTSVDRDYKEQMALYAQGRQSLDEVNLLRKIVKWAPLTEKENGSNVTWTMASKHIIRLDDSLIDNDRSKAVDFGIRNSLGRYVGDIKADVNSDNRADYVQLGELGEEIGGSKIRAGMRFRNAAGRPRPDFCHFEEAT